MPVSRLAGMAGIGVDRMGAAADALADPSVLRLENLDTDLAPPAGVVEATRAAAARDDANSYLPFLGADDLRAAAAALVGRAAGIDYDWRRSTLVTAGGLSGILNVLLALLEPGDEVVMPSPIYIGLVNRVRLAGGVPVFAPMRRVDGQWRFDAATLAAVVTRRTRVFLMMSPVMPSGAVLDAGDWRAIAEACVAADAWLLYDAAMARILFDDHPLLHPAALPGMAARTITVGSVAKEQRMIGWRIGWVVAPEAIVDDIGLVSISNVVCPVGIAQAAAVRALAAGDDDVAAATAEWQRRRDLMLDELRGYPLLRPAGGWSMLLDCKPLGLDGEQAAARLFAHGRIAATAMRGWGDADSARYLRFVYANESCQRLAGLRARVEAALGPPVASAQA